MLAVVKNSLFDGKHRVTLVFETSSQEKKPLIVLSLNPSDGSILAILIPQNLQVLVPKGFGAYQIGSVYRLGRLREGGGGGPLLRETMQDFLGVIVDGWVVTNTPFKGSDIKLLLKDSLLVRGTDTNLTAWDKVRILFWAGSVKRENSNVIELHALNILKKRQLVDQTEVLETESSLLDGKIGTLFTDTTFLAERKSVEIVNGTDVQGVASRIARIITNMGGEVLFVKTAREPLAYSRIETHDESYTAKKLERSLGLPLFKKKKDEGKTDILIVIGEDFLP